MHIQIGQMMEIYKFWLHCAVYAESVSNVDIGLDTQRLAIYDS